MEGNDLPICSHMIECDAFDRTILAPPHRSAGVARCRGVAASILLHLAVLATVIFCLPFDIGSVVPPELISVAIIQEPEASPPIAPPMQPAAATPPTPVLPASRPAVPSEARSPHLQHRAFRQPPRTAPSTSLSPEMSPAVAPRDVAGRAASGSVPSEDPVRPVHIAASVDPDHPCRAPEYPPASRRKEESGVVVVKFLINEDGTVIDSRIESPSGYPRLDEAARAALSLCHFRPASADGKPDRAWASIRYTWKLE